MALFHSRFPVALRGTLLQEIIWKGGEVLLHKLKTLSLHLYHKFFNPNMKQEVLSHVEYADFS
jgi:hypothetical protein